MSRRTDGTPTKTPRVPVSLVKGLDEEQLAEFHSDWKRSSAIRENVVGVLTKELERAIMKDEDMETTLSSPNALSIVADNAGYRRALRYAISLLRPTE